MFIGLSILKRLFKNKKQRFRLILFPVLFLFIASVFLVVKLAVNEEIVAGVPLYKVVSSNPALLEEDLSQKIAKLNKVDVKVYVNGSRVRKMNIERLGVEFSQNSLSNLFRYNYINSVWGSFTNDIHASGAIENGNSGTAENTANIYLVLNKNVWQSFIDDIKADVELEPLISGVFWSEDAGWYLQKPKRGVRLDMEKAEKSLLDLISDLQKERGQYTL